MQLVLLLACLFAARAYHAPYLGPRSHAASLAPHSLAASRSLAPFRRNKVVTHTRLWFEPVSGDNSVDLTSFKGEDAANFVLEQQDADKWKKFTAAVAVVLSFVFYVWIYNGGPQWGLQYKDYLENISNGDTTTVIVLMLSFFAFCHSGLASLRPFAENIIGARAWRVIFALVSLPLAFSSIVYFINHRYDGIQLWDLRTDYPVHDIVWWTSLISFFFLYPSTFNLLEIAAIEKPQLHLYESGITRITRHPQMVGQLMWCFAHTLYIGTTFTIATSFMLCAHHLFAVWNGDRRLRDKFGEKADIVFDRTSVVPFAAIISGKQQLPSDYYKEFIRLPYLTVLVGTIIAYYAHPFMQAGSTLLHW